MDIKSEVRSQIVQGWETMKNFSKEVQEKLDATSFGQALQWEAIKPRIDQFENQLKQMGHQAVHSASEIWGEVKQSIQSFRKHD